MEIFTAAGFAALLQVMAIDLVLAGDNAVVIGLAAAGLAKEQRSRAILIGIAAATILRIIFALIVTYLLGVPYLKVIGGILLFWIAIKLAVGEEEAHSNIEASESLWKAVRTIAIADAVMSLDNVIAIAAASRGHAELFIFGLLLSIPLIIMGAQLLTSLIERFPILVWLGAALLGWIAAEMILGDIAVLRWLQANWPTWVMPVAADVNPLGIGPANVSHYVAAVIGAVFVCIVGYILKKKPVDQPG